MAQSTKYVDRDIPQISLESFESRIAEITEQLCDAAEHVGFFSIVDHGISPEDVDAMFQTSESFFGLPYDIKATVPWNPNNVGWENRSQVRPSTGAADMKESYQLQFGENMRDLWMSDEHLPGFQSKCLGFMHRLQEISERLMVCLARGLGFEDDYFIKVHDAALPSCQSVLRLLHYYPTPETNDGRVYHRAGAHADWGLLTLLFQREGQSGLEICPGRESVTEFGLGDTWTRVNFVPGSIICNIGDLLMSWSDDRFKSTFHRVKAPCEPGDFYGERYSIAFFVQPCKDAVIQGPKKKYPPITGKGFIANAMSTHFAALQATLKAQAETGTAQSNDVSSVPVQAAA
ncbi:oxoglutarate/iron-dependent oxygenase [Xylariales sp. AK1849]|nr:oxoglutarate/iron-dependent oxygenase [Xylariales sp. AK1849]